MQAIWVCSTTLQWEKLGIWGLQSQNQLPLKPIAIIQESTWWLPSCLVRKAPVATAFRTERPGCMEENNEYYYISLSWPLTSSSFHK